jgi:hypothetical protein
MKLFYHSLGLEHNLTDNFTFMTLRYFQQRLCVNQKVNRWGVESIEFINGLFERQFCKYHTKVFCNMLTNISGHFRLRFHTVHKVELSLSCMEVVLRLERWSYTTAE